MYNVCADGAHFYCDALRHLIPFIQFEKREKHPWKVLLLIKWVKPAILLKVTLLNGCFSRFLNCRNGTKTRKALQC